MSARLGKRFLPQLPAAVPTAIALTVALASCGVLTGARERLLPDVTPPVLLGLRTPGAVEVELAFDEPVRCALEDLQVLPPCPIASVTAQGCLLVLSVPEQVPGARYHLEATVEDEQGNLQGAAAVIDKDLATSLLAKELKADVLIISTAIEKVCLNYRKPDQKDIARMTLAEAKRYLAEGHFAPGSMKPKIEAIVEFLEAGGKQALITDPQHLVPALEGRTGTWIVA